MSRVEEFCSQIGLTATTKRWLAEHHGDPLRDEIVMILTDAFEHDLDPTYLQILRSKIAKIAA